MKRKFPLGFVITACLLIASCLISGIMLKDYNVKKCFIAIIPAVVFSAAFIIEIVIYQKNSTKHIEKLNDAVNVAGNKVLYYAENPIVILGEKDEILWCNREFDTHIMPGEQAFGCDIGKTLGIDMKALMTDNVSKIQYNDRIYKISCVPITDVAKSMVYLSFSDITEFAELFGKYKRTRPVVILLVIDNYEDVMQNFKESEKAQISAAIETLLEEFMAKTTGVLRKLSNDKFIAIIEDQHLNEIITSKFTILDNARNITVGDKNSIVTFSIGVGRSGETLDENEKLAKQALDMCLGRGGDQAAIKTDNGYRFFGGVAKGVEKTSKVKSRIISNELQKLIASAEDVYIMGHRFADLDAVGAGAGLAGAIRQLGKNAYFVVDFQKNLSGVLVKKLQKELDYDNFLISPEDAKRTFGETSLLIIVDTHNKELVESKDLFELANLKVVIDHHRKSVNYIEDTIIFHHDPCASSASEMVTELIQYFKNVNSIPSVLAEALLSGIMLDTKNFIMHTGVRTFEAAAYLRKNGADTVKVKSLFTSSIDSYRKRATLISSAEVISKCAIAVAEKDTDDIRIIAPQAADELLGIQDVDASFVIYKTGNVTNISARSLGLINVQIIMEKLGGGGHQTMAAAQLKDISPIKAKEKLLEAINSEEGE